MSCSDFETIAELTIGFVAGVFLVLSMAAMTHAVYKILKGLGRE